MDGYLHKIQHVSANCRCDIYYILFYFEVTCDLLRLSHDDELDALRLCKRVSVTLDHLHLFFFFPARAKFSVIKITWFVRLHRE